MKLASDRAMMTLAPRSERNLSIKQPALLRANAMRALARGVLGAVAAACITATGAGCASEEEVDSTNPGEAFRVPATQQQGRISVLPSPVRALSRDPAKRRTGEFDTVIQHWHVHAISTAEFTGTIVYGEGFDGHVKLMVGMPLPQVLNDVQNRPTLIQSAWVIEPTESADESTVMKDPLINTVKLSPEMESWVFDKQNGELSRLKNLVDKQLVDARTGGSSAISTPPTPDELSDGLKVQPGPPVTLAINDVWGTLSIECQARILTSTLANIVGMIPAPGAALLADATDLAMWGDIKAVEIKTKSMLGAAAAQFLAELSPAKLKKFLGVAGKSIGVVATAASYAQLVMLVTKPEWYLPALPQCEKHFRSKKT